MEIRLSKKLLIPVMGWVKRGTKITLPDKYAERLINAGYASEVKSRKRVSVEKEEKPEPVSIEIEAPAIEQQEE